MALLAPVIAPDSPTDINYTPMLGISARHLLGTDRRRAMTFSRSWFTAARASLYVGLAAAAIITLIQLVMGVFSGYVGGWVDGVLATITNIFLVVPEPRPPDHHRGLPAPERPDGHNVHPRPHGLGVGRPGAASAGHFAAGQALRRGVADVG